MPTFAELRAKAEAAAVAAKETANSKVADYRGDKKPERPESKWASYKPPPLKPAGTSASMKRPPPIPDRTSRPESFVPAKTQPVQGYDIEEHDDTTPAKNGQRGVHVAEEYVHDVESQEEDNGINVLLEDKASFFQFMDEFFASRGFNVKTNAVASQSQQAQSLSRPSTPKQSSVSQKKRTVSQSAEVETRRPSNELRSSSTTPQRRVPPPIAPRPHKPVDKKIIQLIHEDYDTKESGEKHTEERPLSPPPRRTISPRPIVPHPDTDTREGSIYSMERRNSTTSLDRVPSRPSSPPMRRASVQVRSVPTPPPIPKTTRPVASISAHSRMVEGDTVNNGEDVTRSTSIRPSRAVLAAFGNLHTVAPKKETDPPPNPVIPIRRSSVTSSPPASPPAQSPPRAPKPVAKPVQRVVTQQVTTTKKISAVPPPPFFTSFVSDENWTPSLPFGYMPRAGGMVTNGQCSAAQLCSYFAKNIEWDTWYVSEDGSARPVAIIDRIEARWKGSVIISQETKKRLFGSGKTTVEKTRIGVVIFQDLSIAWYRVIWKDDDPIKSLKREARYRPSPGPWEGDKLYAAHLQYGQALADSAERAIQMRQFIGGGEARDLISGTIANVTRTKPSLPPIVPSIGHCHGHLIYEGYVFDEGQRAWGFPRGGETAIRNGDIIEWCDAEFQITDDGGQTTILSVGESGYTSLILSGEEFPSPLASDGHCLPPNRLPALEIAMQSAASNQPPHVKTVKFSTMTRGRIWIFRCIGWDYLGVQNGREPEAEWPPPDPTLFLPE